MPHFYMKNLVECVWRWVCQCPLGLVPHCYKSYCYKGGDPRVGVSMPSRASTSLLQRRNRCIQNHPYSVSMPSRASTSLLLYTCPTKWWTSKTCQCPLGLVPHCYCTHVQQNGGHHKRVNALSG